ncbi:MAG TPA: SusD/RagB family nutrient-binding outer membrane lipoprotein [Puia sp.]|nr:SusD/RagB family nutrient-binding outer membrane lipoprotein [Puia sp.]
MNQKIFLAVCISTALWGASCKKDFVSINTNPNAVSAEQEQYASLLTNAELITSGNSDGNAYEDWRGNLIYASCMIQHLSSTAGYWNGDKYFNNAGYLSSYWDQDFGPQASGSNNQNSNSAPVTNLVDITYNLKNVAAQINLYNEARIFKVYAFQRLTDMYGDIPYSQAGLGYLENITEPAYDKQQTIYMDMLNQLDSAASALSASATTPGASDLIYGGDVAKWQKFAYSEMVRIAMRLSKVDPATAQTWVQKAVAGGVFASNADNAILVHEAAAPNGAGSQVANGSGQVLGIIDATSAHLSQTFVNFLNSTGDPRLPYLGTIIADATVKTDMGDTAAAHQLGQPNGYDAAGGPTDISKAPGYPGNQNGYSYVNRYTFARGDAPTFFLTYSETELLLAEAAYRGWISGSAAAYYSNGVTAAMQQLVQAGAGPSQTLTNAYVTGHPLVAGSELKMINDQYWVASFMDETESWANWRRSGYPVLTPVNYVGNATNGTIPRRYTYSTAEAATNPTNYASAVSGLSNGDKMTSRVWWDK